MRKLRLFEAIGGFRNCPALTVPLISAEELLNPILVRGLRWSAFMHGVRAAEWVDHAANLYRDYPGEITDSGGRNIDLDMTPLEDAPIEWWRDFCCRPCSMAVVPRVRVEAWERVRVLGTIMRANSLAEAYLWGLDPANLNRPPRKA